MTSFFASAALALSLIAGQGSDKPFVPDLLVPWACTSLEPAETIFEKAKASAEAVEYLQTYVALGLCRWFGQARRLPLALYTVHNEAVDFENDRMRLISAHDSQGTLVYTVIWTNYSEPGADA